MDLQKRLYHVTAGEIKIALKKKFFKKILFDKQVKVINIYLLYIHLLNTF